ncbi:MAG TPA: phospholipase D family protein [Woeseiaceae bacterium]
MKRRLGDAIAPLVAAHPGRSGVYPLTGGQDAFAVRLRLAQAAERSIDAQYYIWRDDLTGKLLYRALFDAAERGVRVRLLLDDNRTAGLDPLLAALDAHPNVEVRLFNPFVLRRVRLLGYLTDFMRLNRRMHSKSFTVDNQVTIIGGRNVGDEYFDAAPAGALTFSDLDVLAVGPVVAEVSTQFDQYWASRSAHPAGPLLPAPRHGLRELLAPSPAAAARLGAVQNAGPVDELLAGSLALEWAPVEMLSDDPAKGLGLAPPETHFPRLLTDALGPVGAELDLVSPYFVPTRTAVETLTSMAGGGVKVRILVNSLEATDVKAVHSGYVKWRTELLAAGIALFEMRLVGSAAAEERLAGPFGSSATSLHAKTIAADRSRIFIGSFNLDRRSASLNTELGFVIESSNLAGRLAQLFDEAIAEVAYRVELSEGGDLYWVEQRGGERIRHDTEPGTTAWERGAVTILSWLPIDWLL